jgi:hypothetical protein
MKSFSFQGELEQLTVSDELFSVSQQCSPNAVPYRDERLMSQEPLFPRQQQQQQQQHTTTTTKTTTKTTTTTSSPPTSDIAIVEIIDGSNNGEKGILCLLQKSNLIHSLAASLPMTFICFHF